MFLIIFQAVKRSEDDEEGLCEYEKQRLRKIKENQAFLASLNLMSAKEELKALTVKPPVKVSLQLIMCSGKSLD